MSNKVASKEPSSPRMERKGLRWMEDSDSDTCLLCDADFTTFNRRHHCRSCLRLVCSDCSSKTAVIPDLGPRPTQRRVCDECYARLAATADVETGWGNDPVSIRRGRGFDPSKQMLF
ncbi:unnamed protein product, partial [Chrysoparadoxa australica]